MHCGQTVHPRRIVTMEPDMDVGWIHPWVGLGWVENFPVLVGWVGLGLFTHMVIFL